METHRQLKGKVALVAGAGSGIGRATATLLAARGASVVCADLNGTAAEAAACVITAAGGGAISVTLDVTAEASWQAAMQRIDGEFRQLDILVNSAGVSFAAPVTETTLEDWRRVMAVNLEGVFLGTKAAVGYMRRTGRRGSIVNVASASGVKAAAGASAYSASKAAVCMFSQAVAKECLQQKDGIRVNVVSPGGVKTRLWSSMAFFRELVQQKGSEAAAFAALAESSGVERFAEPEEVAEAIVHLASDQSLCVTGVNLVIDSGYVL